MVYCSLAAKNLNCHPTLIIETLDGAMLSISSAIQEEVFEWFITKSLIGLGIDSTLQIIQSKDKSAQMPGLVKHTQYRMVFASVSVISHDC